MYLSCLGRFDCREPKAFLQSMTVTNIISDLAKGDLTNFRAEVAEIAVRIVVAALIFVGSILVARYTRRGLSRILDRGRVSKDPLLRNFFLRATSIAISVLGLLIALTYIGFDVTAFVAGLGITGLILGFGFKDVLSNFAAGLLLLIYRPFRAGEIIEVEGTQGTVNELTIVNVNMTTNDGIHVIMPNSKVWGAKIINYSLSERRRLELTLKIKKEHLNLATGVIDSVLESDERILKTPAPITRVTSISDGTAALSMLVWTKPEDYSSVVADEYARLLKAFGVHQLEIL